MAGFTDHLDVRNKLEGRVHEWQTLEPFSFYLGAPGGPTIEVPVGFATDFASVPRPLWWWIAPWGRHGRAAIIHDFLYQGGSITEPGGGEEPARRRPSRSEADGIFRDGMKILDRVIIARSNPPWLRPVRRALALPRRWVIWLGARLFGIWSYRQ